MPCAVSQSEIDYYNNLFQKKQDARIAAAVERDENILEDEDLNSLALTKTVACYLIKRLKEKEGDGAFLALPFWVQVWSEHHDKEDAKRNENT